MFENCALFTDCVSEINNKQIDNVKGIDLVMSMYNSIKYSHNYSETSRSLWQMSVFNTVNFESFKSRIKITGKPPADGKTKDVKIAVPLKCLSNFWRTLEMALIKCEINLIFTWIADCVIFSSTGKQNL